MKTMPILLACLTIAVTSAPAAPVASADATPALPPVFVGHGTVSANETTAAGCGPSGSDPCYESCARGDVVVTLVQTSASAAEAAWTQKCGAVDADHWLALQGTPETGYSGSTSDGCTQTTLTIGVPSDGTSFDFTTVSCHPEDGTTWLRGTVAFARVP